MTTLVRDLRGRPVFYLDGEVGRDDNGKPVASRTGDDKQAIKLAEHAAAWMRQPSGLPGRKFLLDLGLPDVATPATQADFGIPSGDYVADIVSPVVNVKRDRGVWYPESPKDATQLVLGSASGDGGPAEINPLYSSTQFVTTGYALAAKLPRRTVANADFDLKKRATRRLVQALRLGRELRVATLLTTSANWAAGNTVAAAAKWNGGANANTLQDMFAALKLSFLPANAIVLPEIAAQYFYQAGSGAGAVSIRDYVQGGGEMPRVVFARSKYQTAGVPVYTWAPALPANVALVRIADDPETDIGSSATFRWLGDGGADGERREGILVREFDDENTDSHCIVVAHNDAEVIPSNLVGSLITGALA